MIFLYLLSAKEAGVLPPIQQDQANVDGAREHNFDLPPRDYQQGGFDLGRPPPLNPAHHGYNTVPVGFGFPTQGPPVDPFPNPFDPFPNPVDPFAPVPKPDIRHFGNQPQKHPYVNIEPRQEVGPIIVGPIPSIPERKPVPIPPPPHRNGAPQVRRRDRPPPPPPGRHQVKPPPPPPPLLKVSHIHFGVCCRVYWGKMGSVHFSLAAEHLTVL